MRSHAAEELLATSMLAHDQLEKYGEFCALLTVKIFAIAVILHVVRIENSDKNVERGDFVCLHPAKHKVNFRRFINCSAASVGLGEIELFSVVIIVAV